MIYTLGDIPRSVANMTFMCIGIWMAHTFYQSARKKWQIVMAWGIAFACCGILTVIIENTGWFPEAAHERISIYVGFCCIFVYLYLFSEIPVGQRIFTYFFVDNSMYILVLLARYSSVSLLPWLKVSSDTLFLVLYISFAAGYMLLFFKILKQKMLFELAVIKKQQPVLAVFSFLNYFTVLFLFDAWGPMKITGGIELFSVLLVCITTICAYIIAFYTLSVVRRAETADREARMVKDYLALSERHYQLLMNGMEQERVLRHNFIHHLRVMEAMCSKNHYEELKDYMIVLIGENKEIIPVHYCKCYVADVLLGYFAKQAEEAGIHFICDAAIPEYNTLESAQLCIVIGNILQNALEACQGMSSSEKNFISLLARIINNSLTIEVKNSYDGIVREEGGQIRTRKSEDGHGMGLSSIQSVAKKYHGFFHVDYNDETFRVQVVLKLPLPEEKLN